MTTPRRIRSRRIALLRRAIPALAVAVVVGPTPAGAQQLDVIDVVGRIIDEVSGAPVVASEVQLLPVLVVAPGGSRIHATTTDAEGRFTIPRVSPGQWKLVVQALGYPEVDEEIDVRGASPFTVDLRIAPAPFEMAPVIATTVRSPRLHHSGFYERMNRGLGDYLTRDDIEARRARRASDLIASFPSVTAVRGGLQDGSIVFRGGCRPDLVIDGHNMGTNVPVDEVMIPTDMEAVEIYRGASAPTQWARNPCGVLIIWTADPHTRSAGGQPWSWRRIILTVGFVVAAVVVTSGT